jgi:hypothetical protein
MRVALFLLVFVVALSVAELISDGFKKFTQEYPLITTFITEAVLLAGVYLVIDEIIQRRETRRWSDVTSLGIRALSTRAQGPARMVRDTVRVFAVETDRGGLDVAPTVSSADYQKVVADSARELGDWLRADDERARSFAREMRQGALALEEAIIRWGPTLVEDPDSAALINLLPDIVDAARSAARSIAPTAGWFERTGRTDEAADVGQDWTDDDRLAFADDLIVVLKNAAEFDARLPPVAD